MKYLKKYNENKNIKKEIIEQTNQIIDDVMLPIIDEGFRENEITHSDWDIMKHYTRPRGSNDIIEIIGEIKDGKMTFYKIGDPKKNEESKESIIVLFYDSIYMLHGLSGIDIKFSFTNFYDDDIILIYTNI
jgi:hypothetical protein